MTRKEFDALPYRDGDDWSRNFECDGVVILPGRSRDKHDSGYRCMDFVAIRNNYPVCRLSGCSDVIHLNGIGGYGYNWLEKYEGLPSSVPPLDWTIDCLPKSGLLRLFCPRGKGVICGPSLSSFEIFGKEENKNIKEVNENSTEITETHRIVTREDLIDLD